MVSTGYQSQVFNSSIIEKLWHIWLNLQSYSGQSISNSLIPIFGPSIQSAFASHGLAIIPSIINIVILALISTGIFLACRKLSLSEIYVGIYFLGILSFWNPEVGSAQARFLIPIIPFLYFLLFQAVIWLTERMFENQNKIQRFFTTGFFALIMLISVARNVQGWQNPVRNRMTDLSIGTAWIAENAPPESVIMSVNPVPHYLYANRKTVSYPEYNWSLEQYIRDNGIDYIIVSRELEINELNDYTVNFLLPELTSQPNKYNAVFVDSTHNVTVYSVVK